MHCWPRYLFYLLVATLALGHMLAACGQRGPLYLAERASETGPASEAAPQPGPEATADAADEGLDALDDVPEVAPGPATN
jgi:predicted small lipoprotein YifL